MYSSAAAPEAPTALASAAPARAVARAFLLLCENIVAPFVGDRRMRPIDSSLRLSGNRAPTQR